MRELQLIVTADDFGISEERNTGIVAAMEGGIVTATSVMMNGPALDHGLALLQQQGLMHRAGLHLVLTEGAPLSGNIPSLVRAQRPPPPGTRDGASGGGDSGDSGGTLFEHLFQEKCDPMDDSMPKATPSTSSFPALQRSFTAPAAQEVLVQAPAAVTAAAWEINSPEATVFLGKEGFSAACRSGLVRPADVAREAAAQVQAFALAFGRLPFYMDGHQHCHVQPPVAEALAPVLRGLGVKAVRIPDEAGYAPGQQQNYAPGKQTQPSRVAFCVRCSAVQGWAAEARATYEANGIATNDAFVGCSLCGSRYEVDAFLAAVDVQAERLRGAAGETMAERLRGAAGERMAERLRGAAAETMAERLRGAAGETMAGAVAATTQLSAEASAEECATGDSDGALPPLIIEAMSHPGLPEPVAKWDAFGASDHRSNEVKVLCAARLREGLAARGLRLCSHATSGLARKKRPLVRLQALDRGRDDASRPEDGPGGAAATLEAALAAIGVPPAAIPEAAEALAPQHWAGSLASLGGGASDGEAVPWFLAPAEVSAAAGWCGLPIGAEAALLLEAARVAASPPLRHLAAHCHRLLYDAAIEADCGAEAVGRWPGPQLGGGLLLLVCLGMVKRTRAAHAALGVPDEISRATCGQLACFSRNFARMTAGATATAGGGVGGGASGGVGIPLSQVAWTRYYPACRLFRLGRMEYMVRPFRGCVVAFRHRATGKVVALAQHGARFTREGQIAAADSQSEGAIQPEGGGVLDGDGAWTASLDECDPERVTGFAVSPLGHAVGPHAGPPVGPAQQRGGGDATTTTTTAATTTTTATSAAVTLELSAWERVLGPGDAILDMHIPAGGGLTPSACEDSLRRAFAFFGAAFPATPCRAVSCSSWVLTTQLERMPLLAARGSNLLRLQREVHLFPVPPPPPASDGLWCIFLQDRVDPATAPRDTTLRRAVAEFLEAAAATGERWRAGGMFFLKDDLGRFGTQCYRGAAGTAREATGNGIWMSGPTQQSAIRGPL